MSNLVIPALAPKYVVRRDDEARVSSALSSGKNVVIASKDNVNKGCTGKTSILVSCLKTMLQNGSLRDVMWIDFGQYRQQMVPYKELLVDIIDKLRSLFAKRLHTHTDASHCSILSVHELQVYIRELICALRIEKVSPVGQVVLVLDGVSHQTEVSMFAFLDLQVVVTTRYTDTTLILDGDEEAGINQALERVVIDAASEKTVRALVAKGDGQHKAAEHKLDHYVLQIEPYAACLQCCTMLAAVVSEEHNTQRSSSFSASLRRARELNGAETLRACLAVTLERMAPMERTKFLILTLLPCTTPLPFSLVCKLWKATFDGAWATLVALCNRGLVHIAEDRGTFQIPLEVATALQSLSEGWGCMDGEFPYTADIAIEARTHVVSSVLSYMTDAQVLAAQLDEKLAESSRGKGPTWFLERGYSPSHKRSMVLLWTHLLRLDTQSFFEGLFSPPSFLDIYQEVLASCDTVGKGSAGRTEEVLTVIVEVFCGLPEDIFQGSSEYEGGASSGSWHQALSWVEAQVHSLLRVLYAMEDDRRNGQRYVTSSSRVMPNLSVDPLELTWGLARCLEVHSPATAKACCEYTLEGLSRLEEEADADESSKDVDRRTLDAAQLSQRLSDAFSMLGRLCIALFDSGAAEEGGIEGLTALEEGIMAADSAIECQLAALQRLMPQDPRTALHSSMFLLTRLKAALLLKAQRQNEAFELVRSEVELCEDLGQLNEELTNGANDDDLDGDGHLSPDSAQSVDELLGSRCLLLADILLQWPGKRKKARKALEQALDVAGGCFPEVHPVMTDICTRLGECCLSLGLLDNAEAMLRRSLATQQLLYGLEHPYVSRNLHMLVGLLRARETQAKNQGIAGAGAGLTSGPSPSKAASKASGLSSFLRKILKNLVARAQEGTTLAAFRAVTNGFYEVGDVNETLINTLLVTAEVCASNRSGKLKEAKTLLKQALEAALKQPSSSGSSSSNSSSIQFYRDTVSPLQHQQLSRIFAHMAAMYQAASAPLKALTNAQASVLHCMCAKQSMHAGRRDNQAALQEICAVVEKLRDVYLDANLDLDARAVCDGLPALLFHAQTLQRQRSVGESVSDAALRERRKGLLGGLSEEDEVSLQTLELMAKLTTLMVECGNDEASAVLGSFVRRRKRLMRESYLQEENAKLPHLLAHSPPPTPGTPYYQGATTENKDEEGGSYSVRSSPSPSYTSGGNGGGYKTQQSTPDSVVSSHTVMTPGPGGTSPYGRSSIAIRIDGATDTVMSTGSPTKRVKQQLQQQQQQQQRGSSSSSIVQPIGSSPAATSMPGKFHSTASASREADSKVSVTSLRKSVLFADINGGNGGSYEAKAAPGAGPKADLPPELTLKFSQACQAGALSLVQDCLKAPYVLNDDAGKRSLLNCCDEIGNTPLMMAVQSGNEALFDLIINACEGSARSILDPNIVNMDGDSPLIIASLNKRVDMAKVLLELGADKKLRNKEGLTAGEIAAWNEDKLMGRLLHAEESACAVLVQKVWRGTREWKRFARIVRARKENRLHSRTLRRLCLSGTVEAAQLVISLGIDVNEVEPIDEGGDGSTPLLIATVAGQIDMVMVLLTMHNANCSIADLEGMHPFLAACGCGNLALVSMFLNYPKLDRAVLNQADSNGMTPLLAACAHSHFEVVQAMLASPDYGASFSADVKDNKGNTPLHLAVSKRHLGAFRALTNPAINCDRAAVNAHGDSALLLACLHRDQAMVAVLIETATRDDLVLENADGLSVHELVSIPSSPGWLVNMVMAQERAAELIQRVYRCHKHFHSWTGREIRARIGRKIEEDKLSRQCVLATRAQALVRGYLGRKKYTRLRIEAVDRHVEHYAAMRLGPPLIRFCRRVQRENKAVRNKAAFLIQQVWHSRSVKKVILERRESRKSAQHFADITSLELQAELERLHTEAIANEIAEEDEEESSCGEEGKAAAEAAVRTKEEEEEAEEEEEVLSPIEAARRARQRRRSSLSATSAAESVALLLEKSASTGGSQRNFLNLSSAGQRRASADMTTASSSSSSFSSFPPSESHAAMIVPDPKRRATMAPLTGLTHTKALADMAALLPSKEVWEHKKAIQDAKTDHCNPQDGGDAVTSEVVGMMALLPEKEAWEHKKDREETARRDSAVARETAKNLNEMMALLPEKEVWEHKKDKSEARRATLMDASAVVLADMMTLLPAQEKWEHKQQQQPFSFASSAGEAANRRASTGSIPALMALELSMPAHEEWEKKKADIPVVATSSLLSLLPTDAEKEEMREEESAAAELEQEPESVALVVNKPEVESVAEKAMTAAQPEAKEPEAEPVEQPVEPSAAELKKLRLMHAFSAVTTKAHRQHPKGIQKTATTSADAAEAAAAAPAKVYSSKHDKVISLIESNVSPARVLALLKKDHSQGSFRSPTGESLLHTALRLMDPSVHGQGQYKQMHECILHMVELAPASARESNHMGNTPLHLFLARLYAFSPDQQGASASSSSSTFSVLETLDELLYEHPAACTVANRQGDLPLHVAVRTVGSGSNIPDGNKVLLRLLKENPEAAAHANQARDTTLHLALQQGCSLELVSALLAAHPDSLFAAGHGGKFPLRVAYMNNCSISVVEALLNAGGGDVALKSVGNKESSSSFSSAGSKGRGEGSALHMALRYKAPAPVAMATLRFDAEEQCETYDWEGCLPLHVALKSYSANGVSIDLLKEIIAANPAATGVEVMGESPLQYALSRQSNSHKVSLPTSVIDLLTAHHPHSDATLADAQSAAQQMREKQEKEQHEREEAQRLDEEHERRKNNALMHQQASLTRRDSLGTMMQRLKSESDAVISSVSKSPRRKEGEGEREQLRSLLHTASAAKAQEAKDELDAEEARRQQELEASLEIEKKKLERVQRLQEMEAEIAAKQKEYFEELARINEEQKGNYMQTDRVVETMFGGGNNIHATPAGLTHVTQTQTQTQQTAGLSRWAGRVKLPQQHQQQLQQSREREREKSPAPATRSELFSPEAGPAYSYSSSSSSSSSSSMMGGGEEVVEEEEEGSPGSGIGLYRGRSRGMAPVAVAVASSTVAEPAARQGGKKMPKSWLPANRSQTQAPPQAPPRSGNAGLSQAKSPLRDRSALKQASDTLLGAGLKEKVLWRDDDGNGDDDDGR